MINLICNEQDDQIKKESSLPLLFESTRLGNARRQWAWLDIRAVRAKQAHRPKVDR